MPTYGYYHLDRRGEHQQRAGAVFNNLLGGIFDVRNNRSFLFNQSGTPTVFNNVGTFQKTGGEGTTTISVDFDNTAGTVLRTSGTLTFTSCVGGVC